LRATLLLPYRPEASYIPLPSSSQHVNSLSDSCTDPLSNILRRLAVVEEEEEMNAGFDTDSFLHRVLRGSGGGSSGSSSASGGGGGSPVFVVIPIVIFLSICACRFYCARNQRRQILEGLASRDEHCEHLHHQLYVTNGAKMQARHLSNPILAGRQMG